MPATLKPHPSIGAPELCYLSRFRAKAVVDWLDLEIATAHSTNFMAVQEKVDRILDSSSRTWVEPIEKGDGGAATRFVLRLHDVTRRADLQAFASRLERDFPFASTPAIVAVEASVDFYSRMSVRAELEALIVLIKQRRPNWGDNEIESGGFHDDERADLVRHLRSDTTLVTKGDEVFHRYYLKERDRGEPLLDPATHCVRAEVRLSGTKIPAGLDADWATIRARFESLTPYFGFRKIVADSEIADVPPCTAAELVANYKIERAGRLGSSELAPAKGDRRKYSKLTRADSELNGRIRDALRDLTRRFYAEIPVKTKDAGTEITEESVGHLITT